MQTAQLHIYFFYKNNSQHIQTQSVHSQGIHIKLFKDFFFFNDLKLSNYLK